MSDRIAYLISRYPAYSHTFILREIVQLQEFGMDISVASINEPDRPFEKLTEIERHEADRTFYVKSQGAIKAAKSVAQTLFTHPRGLARGCLQALKLGGWDIRRGLYHVFYLLEALLIGQWMHRLKLSHLHVHFATPAASVGMLVKTVFGTSFSFTVHGPDEFYDAPGYRLPEKIMAADFIFCISHYARSQAMKLSPVEAWPKFDVCRLGVDPERFAPIPKTQAQDRSHLLCVGRLTPAKGQAILLEAMAKLVGQGVPVSLTLVGTGPDLESLMSYAEQLGITRHVTFAGAVDQDHILDFYQAADMFVLPSFAEGLPVVLMEAMSMEIPCVTTAITGIPELIQNGVNGLLTAASDTDGLADAIKLLIDDPQMRRKLGEAGRQKVLSDYDLHKNSHHLYMTLSRRLSEIA